LNELLGSLRELRKAAPTVFCGLNVCQRRGFEAMYTLQDCGQIPHVALVTPANGVGKTQMLVQDLVGWTKGSDFLNKAVFPVVALEFYDSLAKLRDAGLLSLRLCCDAEDVKEGGSVYLTVKEWIPDARFSAMDTNKCYRQIDIPHPTIRGRSSSISVKTYNQEVRKLSGSNCHRIWLNEPMPQEQWGETVSRTRSRKGHIPGTIAMFATVLNQAPYVSELIDNPRNVHITGHCWENCVGEDVTAEMAAEVRRDTGIVLQRNPEGRGYITGGVLTKQSIEDIYNNMECSPEEMQARRSGKFMHLEGRIFKELREDVHRVADEVYEKVPKGWPVIQVVDPHDRHPDFSAWFLVTPSNKLVAIAESPAYEGHQYFESMRNRTMDIHDTCMQWRRIEADLGVSVVARIGDPNKFRNPNPRNNQLLLWDYAEEGFNFDTSVSDDITIGHNKLHAFFKYNHTTWETDKNNPANLPRMMFTQSCRNIWRSLTHYSWLENKDPNVAPSERLNQKFKGPVDVCRYAAVWVDKKDFQQLKRDPNRVEYGDLIKQSRLPRAERDTILTINHTRPRGIAAALGASRRSFSRCA
jgi:phage terminase large subunit-like protein